MAKLAEPARARGAGTSGGPKKVTARREVLRTVTYGPSPTDGHCAKPQSQRRRAQKRVVTVRRTCASSHSILLRLVLRTQPRSGLARFGTAPGVKFLTVRGLISLTAITCCKGRQKGESGA